MGLLGACLTLGRLHAAKRAFDRDKAAPQLDYLFWEATLRCNLACRHCGSSCSPEDPRTDDLPGDEVVRIFREIAEDAGGRRITIAVTGGEPLLRRDLFDVMGAAHELGFYWGVVTNGVLVTERTVEAMATAGMNTASLSIDGDATAHAVLRGSVELYEKAMRGLRLLVAARFLDSVQVGTVVHAANVDRLDRMYDTFAELGVSDWRLLMIDPIGRMRDPENRHLLLDGGQLRRLLDFVVARRAAGGMPVTFEESGFLGLEYEGKVRDHYFQCPAGITIGGLLHDGAIGACPSLERCMVEGDARTERFSEVWRTRFRRHRDREARRCGPCLDCRWWSYCEGGSLHLWDWERGEPRLCHHRMLGGRA